MAYQKLLRMQLCKHCCSFPWRTYLTELCHNFSSLYQAVGHFYLCSAPLHLVCFSVCGSTAVLEVPSCPSRSSFIPFSLMWMSTVGMLSTRAEMPCRSCNLWVVVLVPIPVNSVIWGALITVLPSVDYSSC